MTSKLTITRERLEWISQISGRDDIEDVDGGEIRELARAQLAAMDSEPVAWTDDEELRDAKEGGCGYLFGVGRDANKFADPRRQIMLYRHAQPAPDRDNVRREHAEWSRATFGDVGPVGPLKHLSKEALEAAAEPDDLSEWADMQFLLWDAQRRAGITDEQITLAMIEKLAVNKQRSWPEPKDGEPRLHIKEQPAPVVRDERKSFESFMAERFGDSVDHRRAKNGDQGYMAWDMVVAWIVWQARAMLQAGNSPVIGIDLASGPDRSVEVRYVAPPGYVMVPKEPTEAMINAWLSEVANWRGHVAGYKAMLAAAPQDTHALNSVQSVAGVPDKWIPVSERMPEVGVKVLCFPVKDEPIHAAFNGQLWLQDVSWSGSEEPIDSVIPVSVTHWMPLPAGPKEVNHG